MKRILLCCSFIILMASCINDQESTQNIHNRDLQAIDDFIENSTIPSVRTEKDANTGIAIIWTAENPDGNRPVVGDLLKVNYTGSFLDGRVFDTSIDSVARANNIHFPNRDYQPLTMDIGEQNFIYGFRFGLFNMKVGDKAIVLIPSAHAYGGRGSQDGSIAPHTPLRFDLELIEIMKEEDNEI